MDLLIAAILTEKNTDYEIMSNKPKINGNELYGNKTNAELGIPVKTSDLTNDSYYVSDNDYVHTDNNYTDAEKNKLDSIDTGANKTTIDSALSSTSTNPVQNKVINAALNDKANSLHTHGNNDITDIDASKITSGTIDIERLPKGALERLVTVVDDTARFALTSKDVQLGDTVKVTATSKMYYVIDETKLSTEDGYSVYTAGTATSVPWSGITEKPSSYTPSSHTHDDRYYTEDEIDTKLSEKVDLTEAGINVAINKLSKVTSTPSNDDYYICQYAGGGTTNTTYHRRPISALWEYMKAKISSVLGLTDTTYGGNAATATEAVKVNGHTVDSDVPSGAKFTDTTYSVATLDKDGLMSLDDKAKNDDTNIAYGTCSTDATTSDKVVTLVNNPNWQLKVGAIIVVKFTVTNKASNCTINVNETGAKPLWYNTTKYTGNSSSICGYANLYITYIYDGTYWVYLGHGADHNTTYSAMTGATASTAGKIGLVPAPAAGKQGQYLRGDGTWATPYTHPTTSGNKHIPSGGSAGQILKWSANGTAVWGEPSGSGSNNEVISSTEPISSSTGDYWIKRIN